LEPSVAFPYANFTDLAARYDVRVISKYASDTGVPVPSIALSTNSRVITALQDASARIASACIKGKRYPSSLLSTLAADLEKGALLRKMAAALAMGQIVSSRVAGVDEIEEIVSGYKEALEILDELRNGSLVFDQPGTLTATLPDSSAGPSSSSMNRPTNWNPMFGRFEWRP
jgi:phage gp36-like protein